MSTPGSSDQFLSTQRKDFVWPYVKSFAVRTGPTPAFQGGGGHEERNQHCTCHCLDAPRLVRSADSSDGQRKLGPPAASSADWVKTGPMPPLLDPVMYPARVGAAPEVDTSRYDQPNVFMKQLQEKFPYLYGVLQTAAPDELISRVNRDRLRSTYQVDFCKDGDIPPDQYAELLAAAKVQGVPPCPPPLRLPGDKCPPNQKSVAFRPGSISKSGSGGGGGGGGGGGVGGGGEGGSEEPMGPVYSEYQDGISKTGGAIIHLKLHSRQTKKM